MKKVSRRALFALALAIVLAAALARSQLPCGIELIKFSQSSLIRCLTLA